MCIYFKVTLTRLYVIFIYKRRHRGDVSTIIPNYLTGLSIHSLRSGPYDTRVIGTPT